MSKTKLSFNVLPKILRWSHKTILGLILQRIIHLPLTACTIRTSIQSLRIYNSVRTRIQFSPYVYAYMFVCTRAILPCHVFVPCFSVRMPLSPDRGLPLSPNSVLYVRPQISTESPLLFIVELIWSPQSCFITLIQDCTLNLSIAHSSFGHHWPGPLVVVPFAT